MGHRSRRDAFARLSRVGEGGAKNKRAGEGDKKNKKRLEEPLREDESSPAPPAGR